MKTNGNVSVFLRDFHMTVEFSNRIGQKLLRLFYNSGSGIGLALGRWLLYNLLKDSPVSVLYNMEKTSGQMILNFCW